MRKLLFLISVILLISCADEQKTRNEKIRENAESLIKPKLKSVSSYNFLSMNVTEEISVSERRKVINDKFLNKTKELSSKTNSARDILISAQKEYDFLNKQTDKNKTALFYYDFIFEATNSFGGVIKNKYFVSVLNDDNYTVLRVRKVN